MDGWLLDGLRRFHAGEAPRLRERFRALARGQRPRALFIACSDSRLDPSLLTGAGPGELFVVRNMGAFVPPYGAPGTGDGAAAAVEFAVGVLGVTEIVVCGHSDCGAVRALYEPLPELPRAARWLALGREAKLHEPPSPEVLRRTERRAVALQLERLRGYPMVRERLAAGTLALHGWHFVLDEACVHVLDPATGAFTPGPAP